MQPQRPPNIGAAEGVKLMQFGGRRTSENVERGESGGVGGGGMGGGAGMLLGLVFSRFGIGGVIVLVLIMFVLGGNPLGLSSGGDQAVSPQTGTEGRKDASNVCANDPNIRFSCQVLASTEDRWAELFSEAGTRYEPPRMVVYDRNTRSGCGSAQSAMGPFYCPLDR